MELEFWLPISKSPLTDGRVKVVDFGIARMLSTEPSGQDHPGDKQTARDSDLTQHVVLGTRAYLAPEQVAVLGLNRLVKQLHRASQPIPNGDRRVR